ncbi:MAG: cell division protein FtsL [Gammaproteobacteria bacterium]
MNAAARFLSQSSVSRTWVISVLMSKAQLSTLTLLVAVLMSALSIVYVTNNTRSLNASLQQMQAERDRLHVQWGQLLLEKSTWIMQARIQQIASNKLGMVVPNSKSVVIVNE